MVPVRPFGNVISQAVFAQIALASVLIQLSLNGGNFRMPISWFGRDQNEFRGQKCLLALKLGNFGWNV